MEYHMSTEKGASTEKNKHSEENPKFGTGQGATDSPSKWNFNDNILTKVYNKKAKGCVLQDLTAELVHRQFSVRFVDDITKLQNDKSFDATARSLMEN
eukprot:11078649-Ditylum_brightwellii.AAC.1